MSRPRFRLALRPAEHIADYIRHARVQTLKAIGWEPEPAHIEPLSGAVYLIATAEGRDEPVGLAEAAFLRGVYRGYDELPYREVFDFRELCPFEELAGVRTVYVEPAYRSYHALYLKLILAQSKIFARLGASFAVATTDDRNAWLCGLYEKTGGERLGTFAYEASPDPVALFLFSIAELSRHRLAERYLPDFDWDRLDPAVSDEKKGH